MIKNAEKSFNSDPAQFYRPQTKFGARKYVYRCVSVHRGVPGPRGDVWPGGCLVPGGAWSWGVQGVPGPGGCLVETTPAPGRLLLRAVRIPLECILVLLMVVSHGGCKQQIPPVVFVFIPLYLFS